MNVDGGATGQYAYDLSNQRYKKVTGGATTHYVWQGSQVIAEHDGTMGAVLTDYVYSGSRMIAKVSGGTTQYFLSDRLSTRLVLDGTGNVLGRQAHLPFGEDFAESGSPETHHFASYERDSESGTDYAVNGQYSQGVGRFMRSDPRGPSRKDPLVLGSYGDPQSLNRYNYARNDAINMQDPRGGLTCSGFNFYLDIYLDGFFWFSIYLGFVPTRCTDDSGGGSGVGQAPKTAPIPDNLRARLRKLLEKNGCGDFVKNLINEVANETGRSASSDSILDLFDKIAGPGGGGYVLSPQPLVLGGRHAGGTVDGSIGNIGVPGAAPPTVIIDPQTYNNPIFLQNAQVPYVGAALHETIHLAASQGTYSDLQLADAAFNLLKAAGSLSQSEIDKYNKMDRNDPFSASGWWGGVLNKRCN